MPALCHIYGLYQGVFYYSLAFTHQHDIVCVLGTFQSNGTAWISNLHLHVQSTSLITTLGGASKKKCPYSRSVVIPEVSLYVLRLEGTLLWAWKCCRFSRIVVISAVVISEVDCISVIGLTSNTNDLSCALIDCATLHAKRQHLWVARFLVRAPSSQLPYNVLDRETFLGFGRGGTPHLTSTAHVAYLICPFKRLVYKKEKKKKTVHTGYIAIAVLYFYLASTLRIGMSIKMENKIPRATPTANSVLNPE